MLGSEVRQKGSGHEHCATVLAGCPALAILLVQWHTRCCWAHLNGAASCHQGCSQQLAVGEVPGGSGSTVGSSVKRRRFQRCSVEQTAGQLTP
jgi:hypothetical protein